MINPAATDDSDQPLVTVAFGAPSIEEAAKGLFLLIMMTGRRRNELNSLTDCLVYAGVVGGGFRLAGGHPLHRRRRNTGRSLVTAALRLIMAPFAHPLFTTLTGIGVYFALQQRNVLAKVGCILLGYVGAVIMHGLWNGSSLLGVGAYFGVLPVLDGADLRAGDHARRREPPPRAARRRRETARHGRGRPGHPQRGDLAGLASQPEAAIAAATFGGSPPRSRSRTSPRRSSSWRSYGTESTAASATTGVCAADRRKYAVHAARAAAPALAADGRQTERPRGLGPGPSVRRGVPTPAVTDANLQRHIQRVGAADLVADQGPQLVRLARATSTSRSSGPAAASATSARRP